MSRSDRTNSDVDFAQIVENFPEATLLLDPQFRFRYANAEAERLLERPRAKLIGRTIDAIFPDALERSFHQAHQDAMNAGEPGFFAADCPTLGLEIEAHCFPYTGPGGGLVVFWRDRRAARRADEDREQLVREIARRERDYAALVDNAQDILIRFDQNGRIRYVNRAVQQHVGVASELLLGKSLAEIGFPADKAANCETIIRKVAENQEPCRLDLVFPYHRDGTIHRYDCLLTPEIEYTDPENESSVTTVIALGRDVTEQRQREQELRLVAERLRLATQSANIGTWDLNPTTGALFWDERCRAAFGLAQDWPVDYETFLSALHPDDRVRTEAEILAALDPNGSGHYSIEHRVIGLDDHVERWLRTEGKAFFSPTGRAERFVGIVRDITLEKEREQALRRAVQAQERDRRRYESLVLAGTSIVWTADAGGQATSFSEAWEEFTGQSARSARAAGWLDMLHPEDRDASLSVWQQSLASEELFVAECRIRSRNNIYRRFVGRGVPVRDNFGALLEWVGTFTDVEEQRRAEEESAALALRNEHIAETLQRSLLLKPHELCFPNLSVRTIYEPALDEAQVGGDFYDAFALSAQQVLLLVGDVAGKGLQAASFTAEIKFTFRALLREHADPATALTRLNRFLLLAKDADPRYAEAFACLCAVLLNLETGQMSGISAGTEPPMVLRYGTNVFEQLKSSGPMLGVVSLPFTSAETVLAPRDMVVMVTDGIFEARCNRRFFGAEGVAAAARQAAMQKSPTGKISVRETSAPEEIARAIRHAAFEYAGGFCDDICILVAARTAH